MTNLKIRNATWNEDGKTFNVEIDHPAFGWIPFTATPDDPEQYGRDIFEAGKRNEFAISEFVQPVDGQ